MNFKLTLQLHLAHMPLLFSKGPRGFLQAHVGGNIAVTVTTATHFLTPLNEKMAAKQSNENTFHE